jgi:hypothetical protein
MGVFLCNLLVLVYFIRYGDFITDFSEPLNLFSLALNSPPSEYMRGSCGAGPEGDQFTLKWGIEKENQHLFIADRQTATSPYGASQVLLASAGPAGGDEGGNRASGIAEGKQSWSDFIGSTLGRRTWNPVSSTDVGGGEAAADGAPSRAGASTTTLPAQPDVIELGALDEPTAYVPPTGGEQQHNAYTDRPDTEPQSEMTRSFSIMARMRTIF